MKKIGVVLFVILSLIVLAACGQTGGEKTVVQGQEAPEKNTGADAEPGKNTWPSEFSKWGVPIIGNAVVVHSGDVSSSGDVMTQGVNATVTLKAVSKADVDGYYRDLESKGFAKNSDSAGDILVVYEKNMDGGVIKVTVTYSVDVTTIVANNSAASGKNETRAGAAQWPSAVKEIPVFDKGVYKETVDMGGGMYGITFTGVSETDLNHYRNVLLQSGFTKQEAEDTEGYGKINGSTALSVGLIISGDTLQIVVMNAKI